VKNIIFGGLNSTEYYIQEGTRVVFGSLKGEGRALEGEKCRGK